MYTWPSTLKINTDWNESIGLDMIVNQPEVGAPIRRLRSRRTKHTVTFSFTLSLYEYNTVFKPFIVNIKGGADAFNFPDLTANTTNTVEAYITNAATPYTIKRQDNYTYTISMTIDFYRNGELIDA